MISPLWIKRFNDEFLLYNDITEETFLVSQDVVTVLEQIIKFNSVEKARKRLKSTIDNKNLDKIIRFLEKNKFLTNKVVYNHKKKLLFRTSPYVLPFFFVVSLIFIIISFLYTLPLKLSSEDLFITHSLWFVLVFYVSWLALTIFHELGHLFVANSFGCHGRIYFKTLFVFPALITNTPEVVFLDRKKRLLVHSSGMFVDLLMIALFLDLAIIFPSIEWIMRFFVMIKFLSLISQLNLHLRTDLYFVIEDILNTVNLKKDTLSFLKTIFRKEKHDLINDHKKIIVFLIITILGYTLNIWFIIKFFLPGFGQMSHISERRLLKLSFLVLYILILSIHLIKKLRSHQHKMVKKLAKNLYCTTSKNNVVKPKRR